MKNLLSFYKEKSPVPETLKHSALEVARCEFHKKSLYTKAYSSLLVGFILSLIVCPQFGLGLPSGHGISHVFWLIGPWACALFCGVFLFLCGILSTFVALNKFERHWFMQKTNGVFIFFPAILWCFIMLFPNTHYVSLIYSSSWVIGFLGMWFISKVVSRKLTYA